MAHKIQKVDYFYTSVKDEPGSSYNLLNLLAERGINLLAFVAVPTGPSNTQLTIFPEDPSLLISEAKNAGFSLDGPHPAILVQGDDELGALQGIHNKLAMASVNVYASTGVTDGKGGFGYIVYVRPEQYELALEALDL